MNVFSVGYQGRSIADFCELLHAKRVELLVDVRAAAWSNRPEYRKRALCDALANWGIEYLHAKEAGNPFRPRSGQLFDVSTCALKYAQYLRQNPSVIERLCSLLPNRSVALMCYEACLSHCHRSLLLEALAQQLPSLSIVEL